MSEFKEIIKFAYPHTALSIYQYPNIAGNVQNTYAFSQIEKAQIFDEKLKNEIGSLLVNTTIFENDKLNLAAKQITIFLKEGTITTVLNLDNFINENLSLGTYNMEVISGSGEYLLFKGFLRLVVGKDLVRRYTLYRKR